MTLGRIERTKRHEVAERGVAAAESRRPPATRRIMRLSPCTLAWFAIAIACFVAAVTFAGLFGWSFSMWKKLENDAKLTQRDVSGVGHCDHHTITIQSAWSWTQYPWAPNMSVIPTPSYDAVISAYKGRNAIAVEHQTGSASLFSVENVTNGIITTTDPLAVNGPCSFTLDETTNTNPPPLIGACECTAVGGSAGPYTSGSWNGENVSFINLQGTWACTSKHYFSGYSLNCGKYQNYKPGIAVCVDTNWCRSSSWPDTFLCNSGQDECF